MFYYLFVAAVSIVMKILPLWLKGGICTVKIQKLKEHQWQIKDELAKVTDLIMGLEGTTDPSKLKDLKIAQQQEVALEMEEAEVKPALVRDRDLELVDTLEPDADFSEEPLHKHLLLGRSTGHRYPYWGNPDCPIPLSPPHCPWQLWLLLSPPKPPSP